MKRGQKVLVLGAGLVSRPLVRYLLDHGFAVTVADIHVSKAEAVLAGHEAGRAVSLTINSQSDFGDLVAEHDLTVSLLPAPYHPQVARTCIDQRKHMVTSSYVSPEMRAFDEEAKQAGVILLNEIGVDPGIDHMSIMRVVDHVRSKKGELTMLRSCCGGLPAPEANTNPLGYKFSWSPAGVLVAMTGPCLFLEDGKRVEEGPGGLFKHVRRTTVPELGELEYYPNRDSLSYINLYGLPDIGTMFRGTFRYPGWVHLWAALWKLGLLDRTPRAGLTGRSWAEIMAELVGTNVGPDLRKRVAEKAGVTHDDEAMNQAEWLGLFGSSPLGDGGTLLDCIALLLLSKMSYAEGERDMLIMKHDFHAKYPDGSAEDISAIMMDFGVPHGDSSMARTVSLPAAIAVRLILESKLDARGVHIPVIPEIYNPVLNELSELDIRLEETYRAA